MVAKPPEKQASNAKTSCKLLSVKTLTSACEDRFFKTIVRFSAKRLQNLLETVKNQQTLKPHKVSIR